MADEAISTTAGTSEDGQEQQGEGTKNQKVPYDRFEEVNQRAKQAEAQLAELQSKLVEFEDRDKSETERERAARERAEARAAELFEQVTGLQKGSWVRSAALELGFHDPEDAVTYLSPKLAGIEDEREAKRLVRKLAENKKHLVESKKDDQRTPISRMFTGDQAQQNGQQQPASPAHRAAQAEQEFAAGLQRELSKFLPENSGSWYNAGDVT
jgi:hypothetical protein